MRPTRPLLLGAALTVAALGAATAGVVAHAGPSARTIRVTEREFHISLVPAKTSPGAVVFVIHNAGKYAHGLSIAGPGVKKRTPLIKPGSSAKLAVTLKSGRYSIWCPVPGHAALGMKTSLTAGSAAPSGGGAPTSTSSGGGTTTTSSGGGGNAWS